MKNFLDNTEYLEKYNIEKEGDDKAIRQDDQSDRSSSPPPKETKSTRGGNSSNGKLKDDDGSPKIENESVLTIRKKVCQKFAKILQQDFHFEKDKAQDVTLKIEGIVWNLCNTKDDDQAHYKRTVRSFHNVLKNNTISADELLNIQHYDGKKFTEFLTARNPKGDDDGKKSDGKKSGKKSIDDDDSN